MTPSKFWKKVDVSGYCWTWKGRKDQSGYGLLEYRDSLGKQHTIRSHRWVLLDFRFREESKVVSHRCKNKLCVRPDHLFWTTPKLATQDKSNLPEGHSNKLKRTEEVKEKVKIMRRLGKTIPEILRSTEISKSTFYKIVKGK